MTTETEGDATEAIMTEERRCQHVVEVRNAYGLRTMPDEPCNAIIPRLDGGPCAQDGCGHRRGEHLHSDAEELVGACRAGCCDFYLGPFASECSAPEAHPQPVEAR